MAAETGLTTSRLLNRLAYDIANKATDIGAVAAADTIPIYDDSGAIVGSTTAAKLAIGAAVSRFVTVTAATTALSMTLTTHGEKIVLINSNTTVANTFTLPAATGSGAKFDIRNNVAQTQGTVVIAALTTDVFKGIAYGMDTTAAADAIAFLTTATSDKVTLNLTTTGGLGHDRVEAWDVAAGTWNVIVTFTGSGSLATPFSAT
jgi:hypothetical protein